MKYIKIFKHIFENAKAAIFLDKEGQHFTLKRGVKQGDPISPKLFNALLESIFREMNWSSDGIDVNGMKLTNLRFADDIALFSSSSNELKLMIKDLLMASTKIGLNMNASKTKIMNNTDDDEDYVVEDMKIEVVEDFKYLGQIISFKNRQSKEIDSRVSAAWAMKKFLLSN